jgi:NAD(P)-dependent dehydrogenase (short-subunit alcohol dehydrogenase family)
MTNFRELSNMHGRIALVTGASGHLGKVFANCLAELGADIILVDKPGSDLRSISIELEEKWNVLVRSYECDLENQNRRDELINQVLNTEIKLNVLVNNAAFVGTSELEGWNVPFKEQSSETWRRAFEVNLLAAFDLAKGLMPLLEKSSGANIVNVASIYGLYGPDWSMYEGTNYANPAAYSVSKGGIIQLTRWLATTIAPNVRVNALSPGGISRNQTKDFTSRYEKRVPLQRMASESDFIGALAFLSSDLSCYVTGQVIQVDGGWGVW